MWTYFCGRLVDTWYFGLRDDCEFLLSPHSSPTPYSRIFTTEYSKVRILNISSQRLRSKVQIGMLLSPTSSKTKSCSRNQCQSLGQSPPPFFRFSVVRDNKLTSSLCKSAIRKLLIKDEHKRIGSSSGASEVKAHKWFASVNWGLLRHMTPPVRFLPTLHVLINHSPTNLHSN
jgi:hypothetical protein